MKIIKIKDLNEKIYELTFTNGFKCFVYKSKLNREVRLSLVVKYGSEDTKFMVDNKKYEVPNGIAHFLEHIIFNEDDNNTAFDYFEKQSSYVNAYTTFDRTVYIVDCSLNKKDNLDHLLKFVCTFFFSEKLIEKEKPIIIEEAKSSLDNPYLDGYQRLINNAFYYNKKKNLITGSPEDIKKITSSDLKLIHKTFYHPKNMFLVISGDVNVKEIKKTIEEFFDNIKFDNYLNPEIIKEKEPENIKKAIEIKKTNVINKRLLLGFKMPIKHFKMTKLVLLIYINLLLDINFSETSSFNKKLINNYISDNLYYSADLLDDYCFILFECSPKDVEKTSKLIIDKFYNMKVDKKDFNRKIKSKIACMILDYEVPNKVNEDIIYDIIKHDQIINNYKELYENLNIDIAKKVAKIFKKSESNKIILIPKS